MKFRTTWSRWWCSSRCICQRCKNNRCHPHLFLEPCSSNNSCRLLLVDSSELQSKWMLNSLKHKLHLEDLGSKLSLKLRKSLPSVASLENSLAKNLNNSNNKNNKWLHYQLPRWWLANKDQLKPKLIVFFLKRRRQSISRRLILTYFWSNLAVWRILVRWLLETLFFAGNAKLYLISTVRLLNLWAHRFGTVSSV